MTTKLLERMELSEIYARFLRGDHNSTADLKKLQKWAETMEEASRVHPMFNLVFKEAVRVGNDCRDFIKARGNQRG